MAARTGDARCTLEQRQDADAALEALAADWDLVITHWGEGRARDAAGQPCSVAERLLAELRSRDVRVPVLVFSTQRACDDRKPVVLRLGALAYVFSWSTLFREIERVFAPGSETG